MSGPRRNDAGDLLGALGDTSGAPDLTHSIMGRLGYMRVPERVSRRRRTQRWLGRAAVVTMLGGVVVGGLAIHERSDNARQPMGPTLPAALGERVIEQQEHFQSTFRVIRGLVPNAPAADAPPPAPNEDEAEGDSPGAWAIGPVRWL